MNKITILGTGNATVTQCYNTCFMIETDTTLLLVDAGGGNGVLGQLKKAGVAIADIHHLYVTHAHTDHILGVVWVVRMVAQCKGYEGKLHVYGNDKVQRVIRTIIDMILAKKQLAKVAERVVFHELQDGEIRFPHLHGLQRQRPQGRSADEVLKHIFSAKGHLQAADVPCYILKITIYRSDDTMVDKFSQVAGNVPVTNNDPNRRYTVINGYPVVLNFAKEPNPGVFERVRDILLATSYTKKTS